MELNNRGYMLVEVILASVIAFGIVYFITALTINLKNKNDDLLAEVSVSTDQAIMYNKIMDVVYKTDSFNCSLLTYNTSSRTISYDSKVIVGYSSYAKLGSTSCSSANGKLHIVIPITVAQIPGKNWDVVIDYTYAKPTYTVSFNCHGKSDFTCPSAGIVASDGSYTIPATKTPTLTAGWSFYGWNTKADGSGTWYKSGNTNRMTGITSDRTLYAVVARASVPNFNIGDMPYHTTESIPGWSLEAKYDVYGLKSGNYSYSLEFLTTDCAIKNAKDDGSSCIYNDQWTDWNAVSLHRVVNTYCNTSGVSSNTETCTPTCGHSASMRTVVTVSGYDSLRSNPKDVSYKLICP